MIQIYVTEGTLIVVGIVTAVLLLGVFIYYNFFYTKMKREQERIEAAHFSSPNFIGGTKPTDISPYNRAWGKRIILPLVVSGVSTVAPRLLDVPAPYDLVIMLVGSLAGLLGFVTYFIQQREQERARNVNLPFGSVHSLYPEEGEVSQLLKRMKVEKELTFSDTEYDQLATYAVTETKKLKGFDSCGVTEDQLKNDWLNRFKHSHTYRIRVADKYRLLLITDHDFEDMKTFDSRLMFDETVDVNVQNVPMFMYYVGPTTRIFKTKDDKGKPEFTDRVMGVFVVLFDIAKRDELLLKGSFTAPTKTDALLAQFLHLYEQNSSTATEMTKTLRDLEKAKGEVEEKKFDTDSEANKIVGSTKKLLSLISSLVLPADTKKQDIGLVILAFLLGIFVGGLLP